MCGTSVPNVVTGKCINQTLYCDNLTANLAPEPELW
jgi:hypothetical protein